MTNEQGKELLKVLKEMEKDMSALIELLKPQPSLYPPVYPGVVPNVPSWPLVPQTNQPYWQHPYTTCTSGSIKTDQNAMCWNAGNPASE